MYWLNKISLCKEINHICQKEMEFLVSEISIAQWHARYNFESRSKGKGNAQQVETCRAWHERESPIS